MSQSRSQRRSIVGLVLLLAAILIGWNLAPSHYELTCRSASSSRAAVILWIPDGALSTLEHRVAASAMAERFSKFGSCEGLVATHAPHRIVAAYIRSDEVIHEAGLGYVFMIVEE